MFYRDQSSTLYIYNNISIDILEKVLPSGSPGEIGELPLGLPVAFFKENVLHNRAMGHGSS